MPLDGWATKLDLGLTVCTMNTGAAKTVSGTGVCSLVAAHNIVMNLLNLTIEVC